MQNLVALWYVGVGQLTMLILVIELSATQASVAYVYDLIRLKIISWILSYFPNNLSLTFHEQLEQYLSRGYLTTIEDKFYFNNNNAQSQLIPNLCNNPGALSRNIHTKTYLKRFVS